MTAPRPQLTLDHIASFVRDHVFGTASAKLPDARARRGVGIEIEWLTRQRPDPPYARAGPAVVPNRPGWRSSGAGAGGPATDRLRMDTAEDLIANLGPLPGGSRLTVEPGGQLELSSACFDRAADALAALGADVYRLDAACAERSIDLVSLGADPSRPPERVLDAPRYRAMEAFFDADGRAGRTMMCNTAAIQVNVGLGPPAETALRWDLANALCPTLIATFANSPFAGGQPSGWQSSRQRSWLMLDSTRASAPRSGADPVSSWVAYALRARVMLIRCGDDHVPVTERLPFGRWLVEGHELGWPTLDDFTYHLTTLFPPVRPRGWFELRVLDSLPTPFWQVAALLVHTLLTDAEVARAARRAVAGTEALWVDAAQLGLGHPALGRSARALFAIAADELAGRAGDDPTLPVLTAYRDRCVGRARSPGDDRLDAWRRTGEMLPPRGSPVDYVNDEAASREPVHASRGGRP